MDPAPPQDEPERGITRPDLELVIRRAAELYTREADSDEFLSEAEVLRIADELGLPQRHVRRALYELPAPGSGDTTRVGRWYGPAQVQATRVVAGPPLPVMDRLEEYLVTREFLQLLRRQRDRAVFAPADDTISSVSRAVRRPQRHWHIARSRRVYVEVRAMPDEESHVRLELDLGRQRDRALKAGIAGGLAVGVPLAALVGLPAGAIIFDLAGGPAAAAAALSAGATAMGGTIAAGMAVGRARFRGRIENARIEMAALLDRLEAGGRLEPPAAPWVRGLRSRIGGALRGPPPPAGGSP
jgi:hypothetical protein